MKRLRASVVCEAEGHLLVVRLRDPVTGVEALYPPGGGIEPGETPELAARREAREETGLDVHVRTSVKLVDRYPFCWAGVDYDVTTHYFAATLEGAFDASADLPKVVDATYNLGASWVPVSDALEAMAVHPRIASACARVLRLSNHAAWKKHPNIGGPASTLLGFHEQFRVASERLLLLVDREDDLAWVGRAFQPLAQTLHHHHHAEEVMLFPVVHRLTGTAPERLVTDHETLMSAIDAVEASLRAGADKERAKAAVLRFDDVLLAHLDREESLVIPILLEMTPNEAWALLHGG